MDRKNSLQRGNFIPKIRLSSPHEGNSATHEGYDDTESISFASFASTHSVLPGSVHPVSSLHSNTNTLNEGTMHSSPQKSSFSANSRALNQQNGWNSHHLPSVSDEEIEDDITDGLHLALGDNNEGFWMPLDEEVHEKPKPKSRPNSVVNSPFLRTDPILRFGNGSFDGDNLSLALDLESGDPFAESIRLDDLKFGAKSPGPLEVTTDYYLNKAASSSEVNLSVPLSLYNQRNSLQIPTSPTFSTGAHSDSYSRTLRAPELGRRNTVLTAISPGPQISSVFKTFFDKVNTAGDEAHDLNEDEDEDDYRDPQTGLLEYNMSEEGSKDRLIPSEEYLSDDPLYSSEEEKDGSQKNIFLRVPQGNNSRLSSSGADNEFSGMSDVLSVGSVGSRSAETDLDDPFRDRSPPKPTKTSLHTRRKPPVLTLDTSSLLSPNTDHVLSPLPSPRPKDVKAEKLYGKSFKFFPPSSKFRQTCQNMVLKARFNEVIVLVLLAQVGLLSYQQWSVQHGYHHKGRYSWVDWVLLCFYLLYTIEVVLKSVAYCFYDDSQMFQELKLEMKQSALRKRYQKLAKTARKAARKITQKMSQRVKLENDTSAELDQENPFLDPRGPPHTVTVQVDEPSAPKYTRAYLRSDWHKLDFISIVCFWISFWLSLKRTDLKHQLMLFRSLMCLKIFRLLNVSQGTRLILRSLRRAGSEVKDSSLFLFAFWVLFAIIGVQSFKSSLRRHCVWTNPNDFSDTFENSMQFCGSYLDVNTKKAAPYLNFDGTSNPYVKGFTCPLNSKCVMRDNPYGNSIGFDNIFTSMEMVFVIISANTFSDIMYYTMDSDDVAASIFFIFGILILVVWLLSLIVAVIINSYRVHIEEMRKLRRKRRQIEKPFAFLWWSDVKKAKDTYDRFVSKNRFLRKWLVFEVLFIFLIMFDFVMQSTRTSGISDDYNRQLHKIEFAVTVCLLMEIIVRMSFFLPGGNWKIFFNSISNTIDFVLAIVTMVVVCLSDNTGAYLWLSVFFIARFYRIVMTISFARNAWSAVFTNIKPFVDLGIFFLLVLYLSAIILSRFFEGLISPEEFLDSDQLIMHTLPNVLISLYTITTTENWTAILYLAQQCSQNKFTKLCVALYLMAWFILSNLVLLNIFIAIITQNLGATEAEKKQMQIKQFYSKFMRNLNSNQHIGVFDSVKDRWLKSRNKNAVPSSQMIEQLEKLLAKSDLHREVLRNQQKEQAEQSKAAPTLLNRIIVLLREHSATQSLSKHLDRIGVFRFVKRVVYRIERRRQDFFVALKEGDNYVIDTSDETSEEAELETKLRRGMRLFSEKNIDPLKEEKRRKWIRENPIFNRSLYYFWPDNKLRRFCQRIVSPAYGARFGGVEPNPKVRDLFYAFMFIATVVVVALACYTTPLLRKQHLLYVGPWNWSTCVDLFFTLVFTLEFLIKVIADGFYYTPNAYMRSSWDAIDFVVLISFWITFIAEVQQEIGLVIIIGEMRALRGLRLLTITRRSKEYFSYAVLSGMRKLMMAALISLSLLLPFSLWGLQLFNGKLGYCLDGISNKSSCHGEFSNTVFKWDILSPNVYAQPYLQFNSFRRSILTLFEIVSLEGWVDLLLNLMNITKAGVAPKTFASPGNGVFVVIFNFCSIVFILNLFVSVIINNYSIQTGIGFLSDKQHAWYEVKRVLSQVSPSKRKDPSVMPPLKRWYYNLTVVEKNRVWIGIINLFFTVHAIGLLSEFYPSSKTGNTARYALSLFSTVGLLCDCLLTLYALGPRLFVRNRWNVFRLLVVVGAFILSVIGFFMSRAGVYTNINKLFLVGILFFLIPRIDTFHQLLKFASASLPSLLSLLYTWLVLFLVYAIALNQIFGMTRTGPNTTGNINVRTVAKALILLFRMSFGEGWNYIMNDFKVTTPFCSSSKAHYDSDCGNKLLAYLLFISWNILSMYIFLNILISVVINSFSYVYHVAGPHSLLTRDEIRKFKYLWCEFDPEGTGFLELSDLQPFLSSLNGVLSYKVYGEKFSVPKITSQWIKKRSDDPYDLELDFNQLDNVLANIDFKKVKERRRRYNKLIVEAYLSMVETRDGPKIQFTTLLLQVGYYSRFEDSTCLTLEDFIKRYVLMQRINKIMRKMKIEATIQMVFYRLWYKINKSRLSEKHRQDVVSDIFDTRHGRSAVFDDDDFYNPFNNNELYRSVSETSTNPFDDTHRVSRNSSRRASRVVPKGGEGFEGFEYNEGDLMDVEFRR